MILLQAKDIHALVRDGKLTVKRTQDNGVELSEEILIENEHPARVAAAASRGMIEWMNLGDAKRKNESEHMRHFRESPGTQTGRVDCSKPNIANKPGYDS